MRQDEIRLVLPAEEEFRRVAHLVTGGFALRLEAAYDDLEDVQAAIEELLGLRDDEGEITVVLSVDGDVLRGAVGPFPAGMLSEDEPRADSLYRVLERACDTYEVDHRADGVWVEVTKRIVTVTGRPGA